VSRQAPVCILEGSWWKNHEVPLILPYFHALAVSHREIDLSHRTIRSAEDIRYYVSRISKNAGAFLYFACHGTEQQLSPVDGRSKISTEALLEALGSAKEGALSFVHFGCCEMIDPRRRRETHEKVLAASRAKWTSGYTQSVDWLQSTWLDMALVSEVFVPHHRTKGKRGPKLKPKAQGFVERYEQLARSLGFSLLTETSGGSMLFPKRLR
jgi:hypothetical protein